MRIVAMALALTVAAGAAQAAETATTTETTTATTTAATESAAAAAPSIVDVAISNGSFKTLTALLTAAGLVDTLKGEGPFTVLAPTDAAFAKLDAATLESLQKPENVEQLRKILTGHVISGAAPSSALIGKTQSVATLAGTTLTIDGTAGGVKIGDSTVTTPDVVASNGIIHVIDTVITGGSETPVVTQ